MKLAWHFYSVMFKSGRVTFEMKLLLLNVCVVLLVFQDLEMKLKFSFDYEFIFTAAPSSKMVRKTCGLHVRRCGSTKHKHPTIIAK